MINTAEIARRMKVRSLTAGHVALELSRYGGRVSEKEVRDIISGVTVPSWDHLVRVAIMLDCSPWDLIIKTEN